MSREIKFRAWLKNEKRMLDKVALTWPGSEMIIQWYDSLEDYYAGALSDCSERDAEVMQYTGLNDRNGQEIYEGDIVKHAVGWFGKVQYFEGTFEIEARHQSWPINCTRSGKIEVVGNICDNPELLEV
ncbi:YopX family protein [Paenibacillus tianjinensis]|uniref:YopX protein domain-containing protein n=1 Tax=Paenibacillus tianjinensis TaxID=2810347 RepID=A0ABX7L4Q7_9BACL|nr:YopX family protein [Paenibacillus tianjinensis]QSF42682.1 hypothetical protein JRJ22_15310 [Paenibacillus tianjinensis]